MVIIDNEFLCDIIILRYKHTFIFLKNNKVYTYLSQGDDKVNVNNEKYEEVIESCFELLKRNFSKEQSFHIILGAASILWIGYSERYSIEGDKLSNVIYNDVYLNILLNELDKFERQFPEFRGVLTGILSNIYVSDDRFIDKKLNNIFDMLRSLDFHYECEIVDFINKLVSIGSTRCAYIETPIGIKKIISSLININSVKSFGDYCCGTSGTAIEIFKNLKSNEMKNNLFYYGEENNVTMYLISKLLTLINGIENFQIRNKDVLFNYYLDEEKHDFVFSDFPQNTVMDLEVRPIDSRFKYGIPNRISGDWAFVQNAIYHINDEGMGVIVGTKGTLVRTVDFGIRKRILSADLIECVITLPLNLYEKTNIGTELIIFNKNKDADRKNKVLFINASEYSCRVNKSQHTLTDEGIEKIINCYKFGIEIEHFSKFVDYEKIKEFKFRLNPLEYLDYDVLRESFDNSLMLEEVAEVTRGVLVPREEIEDLSNVKTHYFINVKNIESGKINYDEDVMITNKKLDWIGKYDIRPNDIIVTSKGWNIKFAIIEEDYKPSFISANLTRIRVDPTKYNPHVLYEFFQSEVGTKMIDGLQTGTTIKLLNTQQLERLEVPMFDIEFMNEIGGEIKRNKIEYEKSLKEAKRKFDKNREEIKARLKLHF